MFLTMKDWDRIRGEFTPEEKKRINDAITGEVLCPRGCTLDETKLGDLSTRIRTAVEKSS